MKIEVLNGLHVESSDEMFVTQNVFLNKIVADLSQIGNQPYYKMSLNTFLNHKFLTIINY